MPSERRANVTYNGNILFVVHSSSNHDPNGYGVRTMQILASLADAPVCTTVVTRLGYPWDLKQHRDADRSSVSVVDGVEFLHTPDPLGIDQPELAYIDAYSEYLANMAIEHDSSVIHTHSNFLNGLAGGIAARSVGCRSIYEMRGLWHLSRASTDPMYQDTEHFKYCDWMEAQAAKLADEVIVISAPLKAWLVDRGINADKITVIGNAALKIQPKLQAAKGHEPNLLRIGYAGAMTRYEGLDTLARALRVLLDEGYRVQTTLAGSGAETKSLQKLVRDLDLSDQVRFLGHVSSEQVLELYEAVDLCVLPRIKVPVTELVPPLKPFEIMANHTLVVASDLPPLAEIVPNGERGLLFEAGSVEALVKTLKFVIQNPQRGHAMAQQAFEWVQNHANWRANGARYLALYESR